MDTLFAQLFDKAADGMFLLSRSGRYVAVNDKFAEMIGRPPAEIIGQTTELLLPGQQAQSRVRIEQTLRDGTLDAVELEVHTTWGLRIFSVSAFAYTEGGVPVGVLGIAHDVTATKQTQEALQRQVALSARQAQLLDLVPDGIFVRDMHGMLTFWSRGAEALYGWRQDEVLGQVSHVLLQTVFPQPLHEIEAAVLASGHWEGELHHTRCDGTRVVVASRWALQRDEHGDPVAILESNTDITARKQTETTLHRQQELGAALLTAQSDLGEGVAIVDPQSQCFVYVNDALCQLYGYSADELLALPSFLALVAPEDQNALRTRLAQRLGAESAESHYELAVCRKDGTRIDIEVAVTQITGTAGPQLVALVRNITGRKQAEAALRRAHADLEQRVRERTAALSHTNAALQQEVAERQRMEEALRLSETRFKAQYRNIPLPTTTWQRVDDDFVLIDYNQAAAAITYGAVAHCLKGRARDIHDDDPEFLEALTQAFTHQTVCQQERFQRLKSTGERKYFKIIYAFVPPDFVMVHREDLTTRKHAEDAQRFLFEATTQLASSLDYETTLEQVVHLAVPYLADWCAVYMADPEGQSRPLAVAHVDPAKVQWARALQLRYPPPPTASRGVPQVLRTGRSELYQEIPDALLVEAAQGDTDLLQVLREVGLASAMIVPLGVRGRTLGAIQFTAAESGRRYDATDLAVAEELAHRAALAIENARLYRAAQEVQDTLTQQAAALRRSNEELQRFAYVAAHDLQEPLRMVTAYVQLLARRFEAALDGDARTFIGYAVDGAKRMKALIDDLLAYSRLDGQEGAFVPTDCGAVLQRVLHDLRDPILSSQAEISAGPLPVVLGNAAQLGQLFHHLLDNAIKFRSAHVPRVQISARQQEAQWVFAVRDNGIGMDPQYTERIFVMFQRLHNHAEYPGTGVGLAICKKVVERHGGRIWVESAPGQGATFFFTLPTLKGICTEETSAISGERTQRTVGGG